MSNMSLASTHHWPLPSPQGKFIRIHFGATGKLASADIETCEYRGLGLSSPSFYVIVTPTSLSSLSVSPSVSLFRPLPFGLSRSLSVSVCVFGSVYSSPS